MFFKRIAIVVAVLIDLATAWIAVAAGQSPDDAPPTRTAAPRHDPARLSPQAAMMYDYLKMRRPGELNWQRIPWLVDLSEGIRMAKAESRPILLWVAGDDPLQRC
jgi:hypothetical protein